jgi:RES domain-containing protein
MRVFRLCKERYSNSVLSGDGGLHADGRWHTQGRPIIYCASSESLAVLELRVHIGSFLPRDGFVMHEIDFPDALIESIDPRQLPVGWNSVPLSNVSQAVGDAWLEQGRSTALRVPSVQSNTEFNLLFNPKHENAKSLTIRSTRVYEFDARLFAG